MSQRRRIVVTQNTQGPRDVDSLDGAEGCPAPRLGKCLSECYYTFRPSRRPTVYYIDPTEFVEPVWHGTDRQDEGDVIVDDTDEVESRPLRLMSTVFPNPAAPHIGETRVVELDNIEWFYTKKPEHEQFDSATKYPQDATGSEGLETGLNEKLHYLTNEREKEGLLESSNKIRRTYVQDNRILRRTTKLPDDMGASGSIVNQQQEWKFAVTTIHKYNWFRSILGWATS
ncbi:uncharacterized protein [Argopecten irradians]|uniref:uncharacterized protein n=1 Tax=Argopecten irradians TaxID=31199 RepID=UPI0037245FF1